MQQTTSVALITGGSAGIGAACVRRFLESGWSVSVLALPDNNLQWLKESGVVTTGGDITLAETREAAVRATLSAYGRIDVLINNAGIGLYGCPTSVSPALFSRLLEVNVIAPLALAQLVIPAMLAQREGTIVNIGSVAGNVSLPWAAAYSASKSALHAVHDSLRHELRRSPVHLVKVCPGIVDTGFRNNVLGGNPPEPVRSIRHVVSPDTVAQRILRAVQLGQRNVYVPAAARVFSLVGQFAPSLLDFYFSKLYSASPEIGLLQRETRQV